MDCGLLHVSTLIFLSSQCRSLSDSWRTTMDILRHFFALAYAFKFRHLHPAFINIPCEFYFDLNQSVFSTVYTVLKLCGCQHRAIKEKQIKNWYTSLKAGSFIFLFWPKATTILQLPSVPVYQCTVDSGNKRCSLLHCTCVYMILPCWISFSWISFFHFECWYMFFLYST